MWRLYCRRCERQFSTERALRQHLENSANHHQCGFCDFDGVEWDRLVEHSRNTQHGNFGQGCDDGEGMIWGSRQRYLAHMEEENVCSDCEEHFQTPSNLFHHKMVHLKRSIECYGCTRKFVTYPAMIIHLESGSCPSEIDIIDLNESAAMCFQWKSYMDEDYRDELLNRDDLEAKYNEVVYPFTCPGCDSWFTELSGLFQHIYSESCGQSLEQGKVAKLIKWLRNRHEVLE